MTSAQPPLPELRVVPLVDEAVERHGHTPRSLYVEGVYLGLLGPTTTFLYRRLGTLAGAHPEGVSVDLIDLSVSLGLGERVGPASKLAHSIGRLVAFKAAEWQETELAVRRALPAVSDKAAARLSVSSLALHERLTGVAV